MRYLAMVVMLAVGGCDGRALDTPLAVVTEQIETIAPNGLVYKQVPDGAVNVRLVRDPIAVAFGVDFVDDGKVPVTSLLVSSGNTMEYPQSIPIGIHVIGVDCGCSSVTPFVSASLVFEILN